MGCVIKLIGLVIISTIIISLVFYGVFIVFLLGALFSSSNSISDYLNRQIKKIRGK
jgi:hypothetical protein